MLRSLLFVTVLGLSLTSPARAQWTRIPGSEGKMVNSMMLSDGVLYVGTQSSGTWLYTGDGSGFRASTLTVRTDNFAQEGGKIYAGTTNGVWMSADKGATWNRLGNMAKDESILSLAVNGETIYAGTFLGLYVSRDGGAKWGRSGADLIYNWVEGVAASGNLAYAASRSSGLFGGSTLYRSEDAGLTWKAAVWPGGGREIDGVRFLGDRLFVASTSGINYSPDKGTTWTTSPAQGIAFATTSFFSSNLDHSEGTLFFTHGGEKDWISQDSGSNWSLVTDPPFATRRYAVSGDTLFAGTQEGVFTASMKTSLPIQARSAKVRAPKAGSRLVQYRPGYVVAIDAGNPEGAKRAAGLDGRRVKTPALFRGGL